MKTILLAIAVFLLTSCSVAQASPVTQFKLTPVLDDFEGNALAAPAQYKLGCGSAPGMYAISEDLGSNTLVPISIPGADGTYYCRGLAYVPFPCGDVAGAGTCEGIPSDELTIKKAGGLYYEPGTPRKLGMEAVK